MHHSVCIVNYESGTKSQNEMEGSTSEPIQDKQFDFGYSDSDTESDPGPDDFHRYSTELLCCLYVSLLNV